MTILPAFCVPIGAASAFCAGCRRHVVAAREGHLLGVGQLASDRPIGDEIINSGFATNESEIPGECDVAFLEIRREFADQLTREGARWIPLESLCESTPAQPGRSVLFVGFPQDRAPVRDNERERNEQALAEDSGARVNKHHTNFLKNWWLLSYPTRRSKYEYPVGTSRTSSRAVSEPALRDAASESPSFFRKALA